MKHCLVFASLISPSKMILFEKKYQTFDTVFHHQMKHLEVRQKYSAARRIFNSLLGVSSGDETLHLMFDILHAIMKIPCNCSDVYLTPTLCNLENSRKFWIYGFGNSVCGFGKGCGHVYCKNCNFVVGLLSTILDREIS